MCALVLNQPIATTLRLPALCAAVKAALTEVCGDCGTALLICLKAIAAWAFAPNIAAHAMSDAPSAPRTAYRNILSGDRSRPRLLVVVTRSSCLQWPRYRTFCRSRGSFFTDCSYYRSKLTARTLKNRKV